ncbi:MAG: hypothetical protein ACTSUR_02935, partial [Candidatus Heimdallarchaeaceae archaeon]
NYEIYDSYGRLLYSFTIKEKKRGFQLPLGEIGKNINIILFVIIIALIIFFIRGRAKPKARHITLRGAGIKSPLRKGEKE